MLAPRTCRRDASNRTEEKGCTWGRSSLCATWDVPFAHAKGIPFVPFAGQASFLEQRSKMPEIRPMKMSVQTSKPTVFGFVPL